MAEKKEPTRKQHYIPQEHLRGFSQDALTIYEYNFKKGEAITAPVPIESVCRETDLYEMYDEDGSIINVNYLEDVLCQFEGKFAAYKRQLLKKVNKANYRTKCFLTKEEKQFWTFYTALQALRLPSVLQGTADVLQQVFSEHLTNVEAANTALSYCLPFFKEPEEEDINSLVAFLPILKTKWLTVCVAENDHLFTSDTALYSFSPPTMAFDFEALWFPISSSVTLLFSNPETSELPINNRLLPLPEEAVDELNKGMACIAKNMVFSKYPFTKRDHEIIADARIIAAERAEKRNIIKMLGEK